MLAVPPSKPRQPPWQARRNSRWPSRELQSRRMGSPWFGSGCEISGSAQFTDPGPYRTGRSPGSGNRDPRLRWQCGELDGLPSSRWMARSRLLSAWSDDRRAPGPGHKTRVTSSMAENSAAAIEIRLQVARAQARQYDLVSTPATKLVSRIEKVDGKVLTSGEGRNRSAGAGEVRSQRYDPLRRP